MVAQKSFSSPIRLIPDSPDRQMQDAPDILEMMVADMESAAPIYQATNYWAYYQNKTLEALRSKGLFNLRRRSDGYFPSFGVTDAAPLPLAYFLKPGNTQDPDSTAMITPAISEIHRLTLAGSPVGFGEMTLEDHYALIEEVCDARGHSVGLPPLSGLDLCLAGNPVAVEREGRYSTFTAPYYYGFAQFVARHIDLRSIDTIIEIGPGSGKQAEMLMKLYPHLSLGLLDLAPQLYCTERLLSTAFPDRAVPYTETRSAPESAAFEPGRVYFFPNSAIERIRPRGRVLFWNTASFGEMEPEVVTNYAGHIARFASALFLMQRFDGKQQGEPGKGGVLAQTTMETYQAAFPAYRCVGKDIARRSNLMTPAHEGGKVYHNSFWEKL